MNENAILGIFERGKALEVKNDKQAACKLYVEGLQGLQGLLSDLEQRGEKQKHSMYLDFLEYYKQHIVTLQAPVAPRTGEYYVGEGTLRARGLVQAAMNNDKQIQLSSTVPTQAQLKSLTIQYLEACEALLKVGKSIGSEDKTSLLICNEKAESLQKLIQQWQTSGVCPTAVLQMTAAAKKQASLDLPAAPKSAVVSPLAVPPGVPAATTSDATGMSPLGRWGDLSPSMINGQPDVLTRSSVIRVIGSSTHKTLHFPRWIEGEDLLEDFSGKGGMYTDSDGLLPLSMKQIANQATYIRPRDLKSPKWASISVVDPTFCPPFIDAYSITQGMVGDCSFVSSLIIASLHDRKVDIRDKQIGKPLRSVAERLILSSIYPQDRKTGLPIVSQSGRYLVKLFFNGCYRRVTVDDYFPVHLPSQQLLCSTSTRNNNLQLWVSIVEKAYMKVHGGYNFQGSNSGMDLRCLTGWIPEQIFLPKKNSKKDPVVAGEEEELDHRQEPQRVWERLVNGGQWGDNLITVNTTELTPHQEETTGLASQHAYAVLAVQNVEGLKMLKLKNPWRKSPWLGRYSSNDRASWTPAMKAILMKSFTTEAAIQKEFDDMEKEGEFFIEWKDLMFYFGASGIFVNWKPEPFNHRQGIHEHWPGNMGPQDDRYFVGENPQYSLLVNIPPNAKMGSTIWLLLTRHVTSTEDRTGAADGDDIFMAMHVYANTGGHRIYESSIKAPYIRGVYSSDRHVLVRINIDPPRNSAANNITAASVAAANKFTVVLSQRDRTPVKGITFSLTAYGALYPFKLTHAPPPGGGNGHIEKSGRFGGSHNEQSIGGPPGSPNYYQNPQWHLLTGGVPGSYVTLHLEAFYTGDFGGNITIIELPPEYTYSLSHLTADQQRDCMRIYSVPPSSKDKNLKWVDNAYSTSVTSLPENIGKTLFLQKSSGGYRCGYCHLPRLHLKAVTSYAIILSSSYSEQPSTYRLRCFAVKSGTVKGLKEIPEQGKSFPYKYNAPSQFAADGYQGGRGAGSRYRLNNILVLKVSNFNSALSPRATIKVVLQPSASKTTSTAVNVALFQWPLPDPSECKEVLHARSDLALATSEGGVYADSSVCLCGTFSVESMCLIPTSLEASTASYTLHIFSNVNLEISWSVSPTATSP
jgi:hypothetical protein